MVAVSQADSEAVQVHLVLLLAAVLLLLLRVGVLGVSAGSVCLLQALLLHPLEVLAARPRAASPHSRRWTSPLPISAAAMVATAARAGASAGLEAH